MDHGSGPVNSCGQQLVGEGSEAAAVPRAQRGRRVTFSDKSTRNRAFMSVQVLGRAPPSRLALTSRF